MARLVKLAVCGDYVDPSHVRMIKVADGLAWATGHRIQDRVVLHLVGGDRHHIECNDPHHAREVRDEIAALLSATPESEVE